MNLIATFGSRDACTCNSACLDAMARCNLSRVLGVSPAGEAPNASNVATLVARVQPTMVKTVKKTIMKKKPTFARLTPAARNRIIGMRLAGAERQRIRDTIRKSDGSSPCLQAVDAVLAHYQADPAWDGTNSVAGGRPRSLEAKIEKAILRILQRDVGKFVVCFMKICTCSSTGGILAQASHVPRGPSQRPLILQFTN